MDINNIKVGITQGDINGVGYEVIIKALSDVRVLEKKTIVVYGSPKVAAYHKKVIGNNNVSFNLVKSPESAVMKKINLVDCNKSEVKVELGQETEQGGVAAFEALKKAVDDLKTGLIDVLVTAPINKHNIQNKDFSFPGHTEYLTQEFKSTESLMLLVSETMKIGVVTGHVPIAEVSQKITKELLAEKLEILNNTLISDFTIRKPRIAILGLNPHAGDNGIIGKEDIEIIEPVINNARDKGIMAFGPFPSDGFFATDEYCKYDAILAMYHDQGLIPFKMSAFDTGVNYTAGLPIVRTSPDHGTAYGIAGKNEASEKSFREALFLAVDIVKSRTANSNLKANQLQPQVKEEE